MLLINKVAAIYQKGLNLSGNFHGSLNNLRYIQEGNAPYEISAISWREQATIWCEDKYDDDFVRRLLEQHALLDYCSASSLA